MNLASNMNTLVRDFDEALLGDLECPVCTEYMIPPITLCCNGHNICHKCKNNVECCPTCRGQLSAIRNVTLENIARRQFYPCINRDKGCKDVFSMGDISEHQNVCRHGPVKCPMNKFPSVKCSWKGPLSDFEIHVKESHQKYYKETPYIRSCAVGNGEAVRFMMNQAFLCFKRVADEKWYCVVQLIGTKQEASRFKCKFTLCGENGVDKIVHTYVVRSFTEDFTDSFQTGKCLILDDTVIRNFIFNDQLNLMISIYEIEK